MSSEKNYWIEYWNQDNFWSSLNLWELNAQVFLRRAEKFVKFKEHDMVLDIGSGPGVLAHKLARKVKSVLAVDAAPNFVDIARMHCKNDPNVDVGLLGNDYTDLTVFFSSQKFSLLLCVSVVQYYNNIKEVEELIRSAQKVVLPGGRMLIADLNLKRSKMGFVWDAFSSVLQSLREGYTLELFRMAWNRWFTLSHYHKVYSSSRLLELNYVEIESLIERMELKAEIIRDSLSIYANRPSLLIHF